jgi:hypothetical protein
MEAPVWCWHTVRSLACLRQPWRGQACESQLCLAALHPLLQPEAAEPHSLGGYQGAALLHCLAVRLARH